MRHYINEKLRKWLIAMVFLCGLCHTEAFAYGCYQSTQPSKSWGYQPVYQSTATTSYVSAAPTYQFHSTSVLIPTRDQSASAVWMPGDSRLRRDGGWTEEEDPIGVVEDDVDMPVGDVPWLFLLLLIAGYLAYRLHLKKRSPHL